MAVDPVAGVGKRTGCTAFIAHIDKSEVPFLLLTTSKGTTPVAPPAWTACHSFRPAARSDQSLA